MKLDNKILSDITVYMKYAKFQPLLSRRENWNEIVQRNMDMHIKKFPELEDQIREAYKFVFDKKVLPSMRSMQFAGRPIEINPARIYNCAYLPVNDWRAFSEIMFLLLGGTGIGFSVQTHHIEKLPEIKKPTKDKSRRFLIGDSIEGWADAVKVLIKSYYKGGASIRFDYSDIRPKGALLVTAGGKAPGPAPLRECLVKIEGILESSEEGKRLSSLQVHDIVCHIADAVLAGGIRRAALISLFSADDDEMIACKSGNWWELNPQRGRANNSVVLLRQEITEEYFFDLWKRIELSNSGEPGIYFTNDSDWGTNPCVEIALRPFQFCNLCEINAGTVQDQEDLNARAKAASFIGTLQASNTDFHYLRPIWKKTTEKDALIGVGMTGIADGKVTALDLNQATNIVVQENIRVAHLLGINPAARTTCVKPSGTTSLVLGTSSGIHGRHSKFYLRRIRVGKNEAIYSYLKEQHPELVEDCYFRPHDTAIISVPQASPDGSILRNETPIDLLNRVKLFSDKWIKPGHQNGVNSHNVSATISIKADEWKDVGKWMWDNKDSYNGLSVLPYDGGTYVQAPFEEITEKKYNELIKSLTSVNLDNIQEQTDTTDLSGELACAGGTCEI